MFAAVTRSSIKIPKLEDMIQKNVDRKKYYYFSAKSPEIAEDSDSYFSKMYKKKTKEKYLLRLKRMAQEEYYYYVDFFERNYFRRILSEKKIRILKRRLFMRRSVLLKKAFKQKQLGNTHTYSEKYFLNKINNHRKKVIKQLDKKYFFRKIAIRHLLRDNALRRRLHFIKVSVKKKAKLNSLTITKEYHFVKKIKKIIKVFIERYIKQFPKRHSRSKRQRIMRRLYNKWFSKRVYRRRTYDMVEAQKRIKLQQSLVKKKYDILEKKKKIRHYKKFGKILSNQFLRSYLRAIRIVPQILQKNGISVQRFLENYFDSSNFRLMKEPKKSKYIYNEVKKKMPSLSVLIHKYFFDFYKTTFDTYKIKYKKYNTPLKYYTTIPVAKEMKDRPRWTKTFLSSYLNYYNVKYPVHSYVRSRILHYHYPFLSNISTLLKQSLLKYFTTGTIGFLNRNRKIVRASTRLGVRVSYFLSKRKYIKFPIVFVIRGKMSTLF